MRIVNADASAPKSRGRPRDEAAHAAILDAARAILAESGYGAVSIEAIAARAGVGKQTVYRRWPSKGAVLLDALLARGRELPPPDTGDPRRDLVDYLSLIVTEIAERAGPALKGLMAEAQGDTGFAARFRDRFILARRAPLIGLLERAGIPASELEFTADLVFGPIWYRLLVGHAPLDAAFASALARRVLAFV